MLACRQSNLRLREDCYKTMMIKTVKILVIISALAGLGIFNVSAGSHPPPVEVTAALDLHSVSVEAQKKNLPILLVFSASDCSFCELLENEILKPMILSGDYYDRVIIRKVVMDDESTLRDFDGEEVSMEDFSDRYDIFVTPTMLFLDPAGLELSERLLGINTVEMFGGRVDRAIELSLEKLRPGGKNLARNTGTIM